MLDQLFSDLARSKVTLFLDGDRLRYRAPERALTPELRGVIAEHRVVIIERLRHGANGATPRPPKCVACDRQYWVDDPPKKRQNPHHLREMWPVYRISPGGPLRCWKTHLQSLGKEGTWSGFRGPAVGPHNRWRR